MQIIVAVLDFGFLKICSKTLVRQLNFEFILSKMYFFSLSLSLVRFQILCDLGLWFPNEGLVVVPFYFGPCPLHSIRIVNPIKCFFFESSRYAWYGQRVFLWDSVGNLNKNTELLQSKTRYFNVQATRYFSVYRKLILGSFYFEELQYGVGNFSINITGCSTFC